MKKIKVIMSCDNNPLYYQFWNDVSHVWNKKFDIEPVLIYVSDSDNLFLNENNGSIIKIKLEKDFPIYLQAQLARIYYTKLFQDDICILSDIDIIPINKIHFNKENILNKIENNIFFHLNPIKREFGQFPMCYYVGYGKTYNKLFDNLSWYEFLKLVISYNFTADRLNYTLPENLKENNLWFSDELFLHNAIKEKKIFIDPTSPTIQEYQRISREQILNIDFKNIKNYIDCHMPRPYNIYDKQINYLISGIQNDI